MSVANVRWRATRLANRGGIRSGDGSQICNGCVSKPKKARDACESALNVCGVGKSRRLFHGCRHLHDGFSGTMARGTHSPARVTCEGPSPTVKGKRFFPVARGPVPRDRWSARTKLRPGSLSYQGQSRPGGLS